MSLSLDLQFDLMDLGSVHQAEMLKHGRAGVPMELMGLGCCLVAHRHFLSHHCQSNRRIRLGNRGPSMLVRETAARELDEWHAEWGYSKPVVALDMLWNTAFVVVSVVMLMLTRDERPNTPIRVWICGYALQPLIHVALVWIEYRRRNSRRGRRSSEAQQSSEVEATNSDNEAATDLGAASHSRC